jgi:2-dehydropantoate 2-reductase
VRYVVQGAGAIGGIIAARLHASGHDVALIARGATRDAIAREGLRLIDPSGDSTHRIPVFGSPREAELRSDDVLVLAIKSQDTVAALQDLAAAAPSDMPVLCAQNGVENERAALRLFENVYGMFVFVFGACLTPGEVRCYTAPGAGVLDLGRIAGGGIDPVSTQVRDDLRGAGFDSEARDDILPWKYGKLLANLGNALTASYGDSAAVPDLLHLAQEEGRACLRAAGIAFVSSEEMLARRQHLLPLKTVQGGKFPGSSAWQSLARGNSTTEIDYLTGEIVMLGRLHGVATPLNAALQAQVRRMAIEGTRAGSLDPAELRAQFGGAR